MTFGIRRLCAELWKGVRNQLAGRHAAEPERRLDLEGFERAPEAGNAEAGYFFCRRVITFDPGTYSLGFDALRPGWAKGDLLAEAVVWREGASQILARARFEPISPFSAEGRAALIFHLDRRCEIELRGYASGGLPEAKLLRVGISALDGALEDRLWERHYTWPVRRLKWVVIGTTNVCNATCESCPTNKEITDSIPRKPMDMALYRRLIDELAESGVQVDGHVSFGLFGDSLADPFIIDRAAYFKEKLPNVRLILNTNAAAANPRLIQALAPHIDEFSIHVEALDPALYRELMHPLTAERVFPRIEMILDYAPGKVSFACPLSLKNLHEFPKMRAHWLARGAKQVEPLTLNGRCADGFGFAEIGIAPEQGRCGGDILSNLIVDADGTVLACCEDFQRQSVIGDLKSQSFQATLRDEKRKSFQDLMTAGRWSESPSCANCQLGCYPEMERKLAALDREAALAE